MDEKSYFDNIKTYMLLAKKEVGQNFLIDSSVAKRIIDSLSLEKKDLVLEIGSGAGSLSYFLSLGPAQSILIDIDDALVEKLDNDFLNNPYVTPMFANAMKLDYAPYNKIVGNLPYYITSGLVEQILLKATKCQLSVIMVQKEAADRLLAKPGTAEYGPINVLLGYCCQVKRLFNVPRSCFSPAPHIDSTVVRLEFYPYAHDEKGEKLYALAKSLFLSKRKTILNNLKNLIKDGDKANSLLAEASIKPTARPQDLSTKDYLALLKGL